jgi:hypothetical protein
MSLYMEKLIFGVATAFLLVWQTTRLISYLMWSEKPGMEHFKTAVISKGSSFVAGQALFDCCIKPVYSNGAWPIGIHAGLCAALGTLVALQLTPWIRALSYGTHRVTGYIAGCLALVWLLNMALTLFIRGTMDLGTLVLVEYIVSFAVIAFAFPRGILSVRAGKVRRHRTCMICIAAALYLVPQQRFWYGIFSKQNWFGGSSLGTFGQWLSDPTTASVVLAFAINASIAAYQIYVADISKNDAKHAKVVVARLSATTAHKKRA